MRLARAPANIWMSYCRYPARPYVPWYLVRGGMDLVEMETNQKKRNDSIKGTNELLKG